METFLDVLLRQGLRGDGAMGTLLRKADHSLCPEHYNLTHPERILAIHHAYLEIGSQVLQTNTFGATRLHLAPYGLASQTAAINRCAVALARQASQGQAYVLGTVGPPPLATSLHSLRDAPEVRAVYHEQCALLIDAGVDGIFLETMLHLQDVCKLVEALHDLPPVPLLVSFVCTAESTYGGDHLEEVACALTALGVSGLGSNCGRTPEETATAVHTLRRYTNLPLVLQASAGLPQQHDSGLRYPYPPAQWVQALGKLQPQAGFLLGGCCGTTPAHLRALFA